MKFWDASAIVPLLVAETTTRPLQALARRDSDMLAWCGSQVECDCRRVHVRHIVAKSASMNRRGERYLGRDG